MKSLTLLSTLACSVVILSVIVNANNITWGNVGLFDRLLARDIVTHKAPWFTKHKDIVVYPPKGHINFFNLTAIRAWDWGGLENAGYAKLVDGGPGYRNATIILKSQKRKPLNFTLEYYGR